MNDLKTTVVRLDFAKFQILENYILFTAFENVLIGEKSKKEILAVAKKYFPHKKFGFIANRIHDYSTNLTNFLNLEKVPNFKAVAVVCHSPLQKRAALLEREICEIPFEVFDNLEKAKNWINSVV